MKITLIIDGRTVFDLNADLSGVENKTESAVKGPFSTFAEVVDKIYDGLPWLSYKEND